MDGWTDLLDEFEFADLLHQGRTFCLVGIVIGNFVFSNIFIAIIIMQISEATEDFHVIIYSCGFCYLMHEYYSLDFLNILNFLQTHSVKATGGKGSFNCKKKGCCVSKAKTRYDAIVVKTKVVHEHRFLLHGESISKVTQPSGSCRYGWNLFFSIMD